jgi:hypothetical protein
MATPIKRIEKEFMLKVLYDEQIPLRSMRNRTEYSFVVEKPVKNEICLMSNRLVERLRSREKLDCMFDYRGQIISFSVDVISFKDVHITTSVPEFLYKNLDRSFFRVNTPPDLQVYFTFMGDRYSLDFPKIEGYEITEEIGEFMRQLDPKNLTELINQLSVWVKGFATGHKLHIFKEPVSDSLEERIIAETGKILYLPSTRTTLPQTDPYPRKRLITEDIFRRHLESTGVNPESIDGEITRFLSRKYNAGFFSEAWIPILFQEYVIGYIRVWISQEGYRPLTHETIDVLYQFAKVLAFSLKENGYFESGRLKNEPFQGKIVDISASGLLFAYPHSDLSATFLPDCELSVRLHTATTNRTINARAKVVRRYQDATMGYFGCRFLDIAPEDTRFLFEVIYGRPFTDTDASFLAGKV